MLSWEAQGSAPPPPRAVGRLCWEAASGWCSGCLQSSSTSSSAPTPARASLNPVLSSAGWGGCRARGQLLSEQLVGCWAKPPGLLLQFRLLSHTVALGVGQEFGECSEVAMPCIVHHFVIKGLQATSVLSPAPSDRARMVLQPWWEVEFCKSSLQIAESTC